MIEIGRHTLDNGLRIVHSEDKTTQMVALNLLNNVGARDEHPDHTGFAHLFEHLMFGGSVNIPDYDSPLQQAGGENNAWTNNDITNYYITLPRQNIETAFWLESDRMLSLKNVITQLTAVFTALFMVTSHTVIWAHWFANSPIVFTPINGVPSAKTFRTSHKLLWMR